MRKKIQLFQADFFYKLYRASVEKMVPFGIFFFFWEKIKRQSDNLKRVGLSQRRGVGRLGVWGVLLYFTFSGVYSVALVPFIDSGKLLRPGKFEVSLYTQMISRTKETDFNVFVQLDEGFFNHQNVNARYFIGIGESGALMGSFLKWILFPDYKYQPAVGASVGLAYQLFQFDLKSHYFNFYLRPFLSKEIETVVGKFIPYVAFPGNIRIKNFSQVQFPLRISLGMRGELFFIHFHKFDFNFEFSTDLTGATAPYFIIGAITQW
ncbi:MAG: hypothetical protein OXM55_07545 [Bdellovibrionales bacterium]|nr:hypothetical protein [Bdellovibrionales bacterium]